MKSWRKHALVSAALLALGAALHADLAQWVQTLGSETGLRTVFFRPMALPYGTIDARRPPRETRPELARRIAASPRDASLYRLRAGEDELALDFAAAESDWKRYAALAHDSLALADYYHRRLEVPKELRALDAVATSPAFARAVKLAEDQGLPAASAMAQYRAWMAKFPKDSALAKRYIAWLTDRGELAAAARQIAAYRRAFPDDQSVWTAEAALAMKRGGVEQAIAVFDRSFRPLMPADWMKSYFDLLDGQGRLRDFLTRARAAAAANPQALDPVARQFHYYVNQKNEAAARRVLVEYRARKQNWTADELYATGQLFTQVQQWDEAARQFYALYSLPAAKDNQREQGLAALAQVLLNASDQPVNFGAGDLSLYRDIGAMDPHPGFLNGILSLVLNGEGPEYQYDRENQQSVAYFHRAAASRLLDLLDRRFPHASEAPSLHASLISAYVLYGDDDGVIRAGQKYLAAYPQSFEHYGVALEMADAFARHERTVEETGVYDALLKESAGDEDLRGEYEQVFNRYVSRLVALHRVNDALAVYRREMDRTPQDPGLYEMLAAFLEQQGMGAQVEQVYKDAAAKFPDAGWQQKLARWYLRLRRNQDFAELTRQVVHIFSGTGLEAYFREIVNPASLDAALYRQVNLYAHERFPDDLVFVHNLLNAYQRQGTADPAARTALLRAYWFYDPQLRAQFFEELAGSGMLEGELAAARNADAQANPAAAQFLAEGEAWRGHFEEAAAPLRAVAAAFPGDPSIVLRASTIERSLGRTEDAAALARDLSAAAPRDSEALARVGDTLADRDLLARARPYWDGIAQIEPGKPDGYLEAATIFWDYYQFDDALRLIGDARTRLHQPDLYAYQAGAIDEGKRDFAAAVREYARDSEPDSPARARLLALAERPQYRALIDSVTAQAPLELRVAVLEEEKRTADLEALLEGAANTESNAATLDFVQETAARWSFPAIQEAAAAREIAISHDPIEQIRLRLALMRLEEAHNDLAAARRTAEALERDDATTLGVVRAVTDFYWRNKLAPEAVATLTAAAAKANAGYRAQFTYEAARKSTEARSFAEARRLLAPLLADDPFNAPYLAAMADTYAQAGDDAALETFYRAAIDSMKQAPLSADERNTRIAGLRRGLIPALTRLNQFPQAVDQYIELIDRYPEDDGLIHQAATFAARHNLSARLRDFYAKAASDSPKDYRWPMVTARLETDFENFDAAIAAYSGAIRIRPDRSDFYAARGALEERLLRFAEAEKTYSALWELSYRDAQWLDKVAELQARQQQPAAAVATLRKAYLDGRPERAAALLAVADKLDRWGLVSQAADFAERAAHYGLARENTAVYARVLTRARRYTAVLDSLRTGEGGQPAMAEAVARYYTPEEKSAVAADLEKRVQPNGYWINFAHQAELFDLEARWRTVGDREPQGLIQLQSNRMRFAELGRQLETMAARQSDPAARESLLSQAADAYLSAGDTAALDRVFSRIPASYRYLRMVAYTDPGKLLRWAGQRDDAADLAVESGDASVALPAIAARGRNYPPVWNSAYNALVSLFYGKDADAAFRAVLGGGTIGERLGKTVDHDRQLAGAVWFYYGARYGEYLELSGKAEAADYLPALLEESPGHADAYSALADWYAEQQQPERALTEYQHALELDPSSGRVHDRMALLAWGQGKHGEATAEWQQAIALFEAQQGRPNLVESFWPQAGAALSDIGEHGVAADLRPAVDSLLRHYVARHEGYRTYSLLVPIVRYHLIDYSVQPREVLQQFAEDRSLPWKDADRAVVLRRMIELNQPLVPAQRDYRVEEWQQELVGLLLDAGDVAGARAILAQVQIPAGGPFLEAELRIAGKTGNLANLLESFRRNPQGAPSSEALRNAAEELTRRHEDAAAGQVLAFAYTRDLEDGIFQASTFLGLAQVRLKAGDVAGAGELLDRMQLVADRPFDDLLPAADLLEKYGHAAEAKKYIATRVRAVPWDAEARLRLASDLGAVVSDGNAPYDVRVRAAERGAAGGTGELALLARGHITAAEANQPFYYEARLEAARNAGDAAQQVTLLLDAMAVHPDRPEPLAPLFQAADLAGRFQLMLEAAQRVPRPQPPAIARQMSAVFERVGDYQQAIAVLRQVEDPQLAPQIAAIERREQIHNENEARRPRIRNTVEQDHVVRRRIEP